MTKKIPKTIDKDLYHPQRDWQLLLLATGVILISIFALFFWIRYRINHTDPLTNTATTTPYSTLTADEINKYASEIEN